ncbi:hypothetical protein MSSAC_3294 [Methanosarcina siciliae C2J]|uniref:Uncharacterized protein n=1 Tax=Methanosarcina siciliae C2J TaxID=1434118 RepID=A0A0E3PSP5_9EURY|nr:hypothetical protein [Methanosarcina siciliae]AKB37884.1 hypothetical protein MSSAC_3294 [Methanosarcina siciliae C2J]
MFLKIHCPVCGAEMYHDIRLSALEHLHFEGERQACRYVVENIEIQDSLTEEELVRSILQSLQKVIHDGIEVETLIGILEENYGVTGSCCMELIEKIKLELDMYCPDRKRLYFADLGETGSYAKRKTLYFLSDSFSQFLQL